MSPRFLGIRIAVFLLLLLSTLARADEKVLYEKPSLFGTIVVTEDEQGLRVLRFSRTGARQSVVKLGDPDYLGFSYVKVALTGLALCGDPRRMLVVGLGGGTIPMFLHKHFPNAVVEAVDIDPDVVDVARRFFGFREDERLRAHVADGRQFIAEVAQPYDAIFLDAFSGEEVPAHLTTREFLSQVRHALKPDGVVIANIWARASNPLFDAMVRTYQEVFDELLILPVRNSGNVILLALARKQPLNEAELKARANAFSAAQHWGGNPGDLIGEGFIDAREKNAQVPVLSDANK